MVKDLTGIRFGRLVAIECVGSDGHRRLWKCKCDCGNYRILPVNSLTSGNTNSCGCLQYLMREGKVSAKRGKLYKIWRSIPTSILCDEWSEFYIFREWAIQNSYVDGLSLIRINENVQYCPENCKWIKQDIEFTGNRRGTPINFDRNELIGTRILPTPQPPKVFEINGESHTVKEWSEITGLSTTLIYSRYAYGKRGEDLIKPKQKKGRSS